MLCKNVGILVLLASVLGGCQKPAYNANLAFGKEGEKYSFVVSNKNNALSIAGKYDGKDLTGTGSWSSAGQYIVQTAVADLNADWNPEVYLFVKAKDETARGAIRAVSCKETACSAIVMEESAAGPEPKDYCGGDVFKIDGNGILRQYNACPPAAPGAAAIKEIRTLRYRLIESPPGYALGEV